MERFKMMAARALAVVAIVTTAGYSTPYAQAQQQGDSRLFPETGHTVKGRFLKYWQTNGDLAQQGYPVTEEIREISDTDGKTYSMQYFERAVFELHPENREPYDVLLSLLGVFEYGKRYGAGGASEQMPSTNNPILFKETGKTLGGKFRTYWEKNGGLAQQGYPVSNEFQERSTLDGKLYTVQYFERAVFELHPENAGTQYEVLLSQLGTFRYKAKYDSLKIPAPIQGRQGGPQGSDSYLIWVESAHPTLGTTDIMGLDLKTNQVVTVTKAPGDQLMPRISGSVAVWVDNGHSCPTCDYDVLGKDLATGSEFAIATGPNDQLFPAVAGRKVAWVEGGGDALRLLMKDLDSGETYVAESFPLQNGMGYGPTFGGTALSDEYLAWVEYAPYSKSNGQLFEFKAMNLKTRETRSIFKQQMGNGGPAGEISLSGHFLVYSTPELQVIDLSTGETRTIFKNPASRAVISGDTVVWLAQSRIWGIKLSEPGSAARRLLNDELREEDYGVSLAIAGDWLVWSNATGPKAGTLSAQRLSELLAVAPRP
jgi:hypothetical protein